MYQNIDINAWNNNTTAADASKYKQHQNITRV